MLQFSGGVYKIIIIKKWLISIQILYPRFRMQQGISVFSPWILCQIGHQMTVLESAPHEDSKTPPTCLIWWSFGWDIQGRRPFLCDFYCIHNLVFRKCYKYFLFLFYYYDFRFTVYLFIRGIMLHLVFQQNILNIQIYFLKIQIR